MGKKPLTVANEPGGWMEKRSTISAKVEHARQVEMALEWLGWLVAGVGVAGMAVFTVFWVTATSMRSKV